MWTFKTLTKLTNNINLLLSRVILIMCYPEPTKISMYPLYRCNASYFPTSVKDGIEHIMDTPYGEYPNICCTRSTEDLAKALAIVQQRAPGQSIAETLKYALFLKDFYNDDDMLIAAVLAGAAPIQADNEYCQALLEVIDINTNPNTPDIPRLERYTPKQLAFIITYFALRGTDRTLERMYQANSKDVSFLLNTVYKTVNEIFDCYAEAYVIAGGHQMFLDSLNYEVMQTTFSHFHL